MLHFRTAFLLIIFYFVCSHINGQETYSKDYFGNTVAKDKYGNTIATFKGLFWKYCGKR
ncbi:MAG: hypothetical protein IPO92_18420 [Saprospiraceae bacterium]|nr:hypothetical protein [Saprospiraceae bacterium]